MTSRPRRVLLVDDDLSIRMTLVALLEDEGWEVREAGTLAEARDALVTNRNESIVVLDAHLPDGLGTSLVAEVRAHLPHATIVLLSGEARAAVPGIDLAFTKAGDPMELLAAFETVVKTPTSTAARDGVETTE